MEGRVREERATFDDGPLRDQGPRPGEEAKARVAGVLAASGGG